MPYFRDTDDSLFLSPTDRSVLIAANLGPNLRISKELLLDEMQHLLRNVVYARFEGNDVEAALVAIEAFAKRHLITAEGVVQ